MKKILVLFITIAMVFTVSGCGKEEDKKVDNPENKVENNGGSAIIDYDAVNPDLKAFYGDYEAFMDEYIAFIKSYKEEGSPISMLTKYTELMQSLNEFSQKANQYSNSDDYNANDAAYIIEVTARINQKLIMAAE